MNIKYRTGRKGDCPKLADFIYIALADNTDAHRLYHRCGFEIVSPIEMAAHELIPHEGGAYLMSCLI